MTNIFNNFKKKYIPIVNWTFFSTLKEGGEYYNGETFSGWDESWIPIATNDLGDVIISKENAIYEIEHDTNEEPEPSLISKDIEKLNQFFNELVKYKEFSEKDSIETLKNKKQNLKELKKSAPRSLKFNFEMEIDDVQETINNKRWLKTKAGQFMKEHEEFSKLIYPELRENGRFADVMVFRHPDRKVFIIAGWLKENENIDDVKKIIDKYPSPHPVEYGEFKPFDEE